MLSAGETRCGSSEARRVAQATKDADRAPTEAATLEEAAAKKVDCAHLSHSLRSSVPLGCLIRCAHLCLSAVSFIMLICGVGILEAGRTEASRRETENEEPRTALRSKRRRETIERFG